MKTSPRPEIPVNLANAFRPRIRPAEQHRLTWSIEDGIRFELECLHIPVNALCICDKVNFDASGSRSFIAMHEGGTVPLRAGIIKSWWTGGVGDSELRWNYSETDPAPKEPVQLPAVNDAPSSAPAQREGLLGHIGPDPRPRHLHEVRWFIAEGRPVPRATCLHEPVAEGQVCDSFHFDDDDLLADTHDGRTALRDGTIESWWEAILDDFELKWKYADEPHHPGQA